MILQTKIIPPQPGGRFVSRPHLRAQLDGAMQHRLALVCAPAGFGKTSLLADWLHRLPAMAGHEALHVAWLALDRGDDDPSRLLNAMIAALRRQGADIGAAAASILARGANHAAQAALTSLLNEIHGSAATFVFVLDDYHWLQNEAVHEAMRLLLAGLPRNAHLVIASRAEPPLPLARLRAEGDLLELRAADLRFSAQESATFLRQSAGHDLSLEISSLLQEQCEGWVAGLQLAALALRGHGDGQPGDLRATAVQFSRGQSHLFAYLAAEVLDHQPPHVQRFLLATSILDRLCAPLCSALMAGDSAAEDADLLNELVATGLFLLPLDASGHWFRYHHLFQTFLQRELQRRCQRRGASPLGCDLNELHGRASAWFAANECPDEAIRHALSAGDVDNAATLVGQAIGGMFQRGRLLEIRHYLEMLPDEAILARHYFCAGYAWVLVLGGELPRVERYVQAAERQLAQFKQQDPPPFDIDAQGSNLALIRATVAQRRGENDVMTRLSRQAVHSLGANGPAALRSIAAYTLAQACLTSGQISEAQEALQEAVAAAGSAGHHYIAGSALLALAGLRRRQGRLQAAQAIYESVMDMSSDAALSAGGAAGLASLALERNHLEQAAELAARAVQWYEECGEASGLVGAHVLCARVHDAQAEKEKAGSALDNALRLAQRWQLPAETALVMAWQARRVLLARNTTAALALARQAARERDAESEGQPSFGALQQLLDFTLVRAYLATGRAGCTPARAILKTWRHFAVRNGLQAVQVEVLLLEALAARLMDNQQKARDCLLLGLLLAQPAAFVRLFLDEGPAVASLLRRLQDHSTVGAYAAGLYQALGGQNGTPTDVPGPDAELTARQQEILALLARGLSNREIADNLVISLETVRWHTKQIYRRLEVRNRTEASAYARPQPPA